MKSERTPEWRMPKIDYRLAFLTNSLLTLIVNQINCLLNWTLLLNHNAIQFNAFKIDVIMSE